MNRFLFKLEKGGETRHQETCNYSVKLYEMRIFTNFMD